MKPHSIDSYARLLLNYLCMLFLFTVCVIPNPAQAQSQNRQAPAKKFDGWVIDCNAQAVCQALQSVTTTLTEPNSATKPTARGKPAAAPPRTFVTMAAIRKSAGKFELLLELPFGINLAKGVIVMVDGNPSYTLPFFTCYQRGCIVQSDLDSKRLGEITTGKYLNLAFVGINTDNWRSVSVPLKGLNQALAEIK
jgi:invasion protein IalB